MIVCRGRTVAPVLEINHSQQDARENRVRQETDCLDRKGGTHNNNTREQQNPD